jgi:hypothetical protein
VTPPTTAELADQIVAELEAAFGQRVPLFARAFLRVLAKILAAPLVLIYRYAGFMLLQQYATTASLRDTTVNGRVIKPLQEIGVQVGAGEPVVATRAELVIQVTVTTQVGSLAAGEQLQREDTGVIYEVMAAVPLDAATVEATILAIGDDHDGGGAGEQGNLEEGDALEFVRTVPNVAQEVVVLSATVTGEDAETADAYRRRVLGHTQFKPQGGAPADYRKWAEAVPGVRAAYPYKGDPGRVVVYVLAETIELPGGGELYPDGIPTQELLDAVDAGIRLDEDGLATQRNANALSSTRAIVRTPVTVEIEGLVAANPAAVQAEIEAGLDEHLRSLEPYIVGVSPLPRRDRVTLGGVAGVAHEIAHANGATIDNVSLSVGGVERPAYQLGQGELAKLAA